MFQEGSQWIFETFRISQSLQYRIAATLIVIVSLFLVRRVILSVFRSKIQDVKKRYSWEKSSLYFSYVLFILIVIPIWFRQLHVFGTFFGLMAAGIAIVLKEPILNFFGWVYIISKKPFDMGDRIAIQQVEGDILDIGFFEFTLLEIKNWVDADQSTGRIIHIPNGLVFTKPVMNYNQAMNFIWHEIPFMITFESNWQKAKDILLKIEDEKLKALSSEIKPEIEKANRKYYVEYNKLDPTVYTRVKENGVMLTLRYLCPPKQRRNYEQIVVEETLRQFAKHADIQFAYPTTRFFKGEEYNK
ncbi:MAG: mechanosensitive ion channel family protein [Saprospiraceae bacterium]|nr:mechanosensitive ion channel family protein [Saprospiraceae bacterium]